MSGGRAMSDEIPMYNLNELTPEKFSEALESLCPSGIYQDRKRPYSGQMHTHSGSRGQTLVQGLTMRDITDCFRIALWESAGSPGNAASVYDLDLSDIDPVAVEQNLVCNIEKMMGIFPNVPKLKWVEEESNDGTENVE
jgi:hypothetical protein